MASWELLADQVQHAFMGGGIKSAGIDQSKAAGITIGTVGIVAISGHARHIVDDRRARAENPVEQGRFADVGATDDRDNGQASTLKGKQRRDRTVG